MAVYNELRTYRTTNVAVARYYSGYRSRISLRMDGAIEMALNRKQVVDTAERGVIYTVVRTVVRAVINALFRG